MQTLIVYSTTASKSLGQDAALTKFTRIKSLREAVQLRSQLANLASLFGSNSVLTPSNGTTVPASPPSTAQALALRYILASGYIDNLAQRADTSPSQPAARRVPSSATQVPYITLFPSAQRDIPKEALESLDKKGRDRLQYVYIHPSSVLAHVSPQKLPQFVVSSTASSGILSVFFFFLNAFMTLYGLSAESCLGRLLEPNDIALQNHSR